MRKVLVMLEVDDKRAIALDKGTVDYVVDTINYQCNECGISVVDARVLDEDDAYDTEAIEMANKIFEEEN